jgi:hypothetical protein
MDADFTYLGLDPTYEPMLLARYAKTLLLGIARIHALDEKLSVCFLSGGRINVYYRVDEHTNKVMKFADGLLRETLLVKRGGDLERRDAQGNLIERKRYFK